MPAKHRGEKMKTTEKRHSDPKAGFARRVGQLRRERLICSAAASVCIIGCAAVLLLMRASVPAALLFAAAAAAICLGDRARKRLVRLVSDEHGEFFRLELERMFGPDAQTPEMHICTKTLKKLHISDGKWDECEFSRYREGSYRGVHFSAANLKLYRLVKTGSPHDGFVTEQRCVFRGIAVCCAARLPAPSTICAYASAGGDTPDCCFQFTSAPGADDSSSVTSQLTTMLRCLGDGIDGHISGLYWQGNILSLVIETDYAFASVADGTDMSDWDAVRRSYTASLLEMKKMLDLIFSSCSLFDISDSAETP